MRNLKYIAAFMFVVFFVGCGEESNPQSFYKAAELGKLEYVTSGVEKGYDINALDKFGTPIIIYAASKGRTAIVEYLIEQKVDVNQAQEKTGVTAICLASRNNQYDVVDLLLKAGADPKIKDSSGKNAIEWAEAQQHRYLLELFSANAKK